MTLVLPRIVGKLNHKSCSFHGVGRVKSPCQTRLRVNFTLGSLEPKGVGTSREGQICSGISLSEKLFFFFFLKTRLISSESWVEEGVGGGVCVCVCVGRRRE
jgi:hypothetical protein